MGCDPVSGHETFIKLLKCHIHYTAPPPPPIFMTSGLQDKAVGLIWVVAQKR